MAATVVRHGDGDAIMAGPAAANSRPCVCSALKSPIRIFLFFHKAMKTEFDGLLRAFSACRQSDIKTLLERYHLLRSIYKHHCDVKDKVILAALYVRLTNVARTDSLEQEAESVLFDHLEFLILNMQNDEKHKSVFASHSRALEIFISLNMSKEEEQVSLLIENLSFEEQASLVWQFLGSIPINLMEELLSWLPSSISAEEHQDMRECLKRIIPNEILLHKVIFTWVDTPKKLTTDWGRFDCSTGDHCTNSKTNCLRTQNSNTSCPCEPSHTGKRKHTELSSTADRLHPIDEILYWHRAIKVELGDLAKDARKIQVNGDLSDLSSFNQRLQFIAKVCIFYSVAGDKVIVPAVETGLSFVQKHAEVEREFHKLRSLTESIQKDGAKSSSVDFSARLCSLADQIVRTIENNLHIEEIQVLPLARKLLSAQRQRELLYQSLCLMPLSLIESTLPWLVDSIGEVEAKSFLQNMFLAAPDADKALVRLFSAWAYKLSSKSFYELPPLGTYVCEETLSTEEIDIYNHLRGLSLENPRRCLLHLQLVLDHPPLLHLPTLRSSHYSLDLGTFKLDCFKPGSKLVALMCQINLMVEKNMTAKGIVYSQFSPFLNVIKSCFQKSRVSCALLQPFSKEERNDAALRQFTNDPHCRILLMNIREVCDLDLSMASHVFMMEPYWDPAADKRALGRVRRLGPRVTASVRVCRFVMKNTIEERLLELLYYKKRALDE